MSNRTKLKTVRRILRFAKVVLGLVLMILEIRKRIADLAI